MKQLKIESRLLHLNEAGFFDWEKCYSQYPTLSRLAQLAMIILRGNAEVERVFSMLSDVITKRRKSLHPILSGYCVFLNPICQYATCQRRLFRWTMSCLAWRQIPTMPIESV